jgi:hypothetical protein
MLASLCMLLVHIRPFLVLVLFAALITGCTTVNDSSSPEAKADEIRGLVEEWRKETVVLAEQHSREYGTSTSRAMLATRMVLQKMGMHVDSSMTTTSKLTASIPPPGLLSEGEWEQVRRVERPKFEKILGKELTLELLAELRKFPMKYQIGVTASFSSGTSGTLVMFLPWIESVETTSNTVARASLPPTATRLIIEKVWRSIDKRYGGRRGWRAFRKEGPELQDSSSQRIHRGLNEQSDRRVCQVRIYGNFYWVNEANRRGLTDKKCEEILRSS